MAPFGVAQVKRLDLVVADDGPRPLPGRPRRGVRRRRRDRRAAGGGVPGRSRRGGASGRDAGARAALASVLQGRPDPRLELTAIGHGHLDLAWLWPLRETRRKARRTLTHQLDLIDRYPEHVYGVSQPQQLAWLEADDPELFDRVVAAMKAGRIEAQGGMWVEADANLPSGESLVRQSLYGQRCWQRLLGRTVDVCWLPDVFGYNGNLPQLSWPRRHDPVHDHQAQLERAQRLRPSLVLWRASMAPRCWSTCLRRATTSPAARRSRPPAPAT